MDLFNTQNSINLSGSALLIVAGVVAAILLILILTVVRLYRQNRSLTTPRYGFLGKPLYVIALLLLAGGAFYITNHINDPKVNDVNAGREIRVVINTQILEQDNQNATVKFSAIPKVGNIEWGNPGDTFTLYWDIQGSEQYSGIENNLSKSNPGGFSKKIAKGAYTVTVVMTYQDKTYTVSKQISF